MCCTASYYRVIPTSVRKVRTSNEWMNCPRTACCLLDNRSQETIEMDVSSFWSLCSYSGVSNYARHPAKAHGDHEHFLYEAFPSHVAEVVKAGGGKVEPQNLITLWQFSFQISWDSQPSLVNWSHDERFHKCWVACTLMICHKSTTCSRSRPLGMHRCADILPRISTTITCEAIFCLLATDTIKAASENTDRWMRTVLRFYHHWSGISKFMVYLAIQ